MSAHQDDVTAYVDDELDAPRRAAFEAAMAADSALGAAVQRERELRRLLSQAYDPVLAEPLPPRLLDPLQMAMPATAQVLDLAAMRQARAARRWQWPEWCAMAACLVLGVMLGIWQPLGPAATPPPMLARDAQGALMAQGPLDQQLTQALAAEPAGGVAVGLSFVAQDGRYCRSFALQGAAATAGLACQRGGSWVVQGLAPISVSAQGYRMAATALPPDLLQLVDRLRAADPLDAAGERAARDRGWRR